MTFRAVLIGLLVALFIAGVAFINDQIIQLENIVAGHQLPIVVVGMLIIGVVIANPGLYLIRRSLALKPTEVAVVVMLALVGCSVASRGLLENFPTSISLAAYWYNITPGWQKYEMLSYAPPMLLPGGNEYNPQVLGGMIAGMGHGGHITGLSEIPWGLWAPALVTWLPIICLLTVSVICIALIVHRQWSSRERMRYPIAEFVTLMIDRPENSRIPGIFRLRIFWLGLVIVLFIRVLNGINLWFPERLIDIPLRLDFSAPFLEKTGTLVASVPWIGQVFKPDIFPLAVGFSFFLASEVSLSLGLTQLLIIPLTVFLLTHGVEISSDYMIGGVTGWQRFGSYLAFIFIMIYVGRRYYWLTIKSALTFTRDEEVDSYAPWAFRILVLALVGLVGILISVGLDWPFAVMTVGLILLLFVGVARINAETGLFFIQPRWQPLGVLLALFGAKAMGPEAMVTVGLLSVVLSLDPSQSLMPYLSNGLKITESVGIKPSRTPFAIFGVYIAALAVGLVVVIWANYHFGTPRSGTAAWSFDTVPKFPWMYPAREVTTMSLTGQLQASKSMTPLQRLAAISPNPRFLYSAGAGMAAVLLFGILRLRFRWWPLHPVMFLVWDTHAMGYLYFSFLLGWFVKTAVTKLGGYKTYQKVKPLMVGVIAGDILGAIVLAMVGVVYYATTGLFPKYTIFLPK